MDHGPHHPPEPPYMWRDQSAYKSNIAISIASTISLSSSLAYSCRRLQHSDVTYLSWVWSGLISIDPCHGYYCCTCRLYISALCHISTQLSLYYCSLCRLHVVEHLLPDQNRPLIKFNEIMFLCGRIEGMTIKLQIDL